MKQWHITQRHIQKQCPFKMRLQIGVTMAMIHCATIDLEQQGIDLTPQRLCP